MEHRESHTEGLHALSELDPAQNLEIDITALRAKIAAKMSAQGLEFTPAANAGVVEAETVASDNVVALHPRAGASKHSWWWGLSAAATVAAVGLTGWATLGQGDTTVSHPEDSGRPTYQGSPRLEAAKLRPAIPGAAERLSEVGEVDFVAAEDFSTATTKAPVYRLSQGAEVSSGKIQKVADSLGIKGAVKKNESGFIVKDTSGAVLTVTVGELTSLDFSNPAALRMECVPVTPGDGNVELGRRNESPKPSSSTQPSGNSGGNTSPSNRPTNPKIPPKGEPVPRPELPEVKPTPKQPQVTPTETPTEAVPPAVRPGMANPNSTVTHGTSTNSDKPGKETEAPGVASGETQVYNYCPGIAPRDEAVEIGELRVLTRRNSDTEPPSEPAPHETAENLTTPDQTDIAESQVTQSPSPSPANCVMKVAGEAPSAQQAMEEVNKVAKSLGATVVSTQVGAVQKDGLTTVDVPVKMPGQTQTQTWRAVVSAQGLASIRANLGRETKVGDYQVISEKQAVERLNDPKFGSIDVFDPLGKAPAKIVGKIELVEAKLANAPVKQKDGSIVSMPVYHLVDTQGRVWTVLAVTSVGKQTQ